MADGNAVDAANMELDDSFATESAWYWYCATMPRLRLALALTWEQLLEDSALEEAAVAREDEGRQM